MIRTAALLVCLFVFPVGASTLESYFLNKQALENFRDEAYGQSMQDLVQALESEPMNPRIHLNLGLALFAMGEPQKAAQAFSSAASLTKDKEERFVALFNEAYSYGEAKQIEKALSTYQEALKIHPDSVEVKTNIELLTAQQGQQGQGGGSGDPNNKDGQGGQEQKENNQGQGEEQQQPQSAPKPKQFKSEELTASDVKKILEELKSQEQGIRAREYEDVPKERPSGKDW